jgi:hypothetical protein
MEGFDKGWIQSGNRRFVTYTNLDPGEYTFKVAGSNNAGSGDETGASIKIKNTAFLAYLVVRFIRFNFTDKPG